MTNSLLQEPEDETLNFIRAKTAALQDKWKAFFPQKNVISLWIGPEIVSF